MQQLKNILSNSEKIIDKNLSNEKKMFSDNLELKTIIKLKSITRYLKENSFSLFNSIDNILYLVYGTKGPSIICFNINDNKKSIEIKKAHEKPIIGFYHYFDKKNKRDILMSISARNFLKLWNVNSWECILNLEKINNSGILTCACFLKIKGEECLIATSNYDSNHPEKIKIFDLKGGKIKEINGSNENSFYIDSFFDEEQSKIFIIVCSEYNIKSYDYENNKLYHKYYEKNYRHSSTALIYKKENITKLFEGCSSDGLIRIWNFHHGNLLGRIDTNLKICCMCLWNNKYLFSGSINGKILIIDIISQIIYRNFEGHENWVSYISKFKNNKYGECLITQGLDNQIKIWSNKI